MKKFSVISIIALIFIAVLQVFLFQNPDRAERKERSDSIRQELIRVELEIKKAQLEKLKKE